MVGVALALVMAVAGIVAPVLAPHDPRAIHENATSCPPFSCAQDGRSHVLGTDHLGRDLLSRIVASFRTSLYIGILATFLGILTAGLLIIARSIRPASPAPGASRPLFGVSLWGMAILTYCTAFLPSLVVFAAMGPSVVWVIVCASVFASLLPMTLVYDSVRAHDAPSNPVGLVVRRGIALSPAGFGLALFMGLFIESSLSFLGVGVPYPDPSLGSIVAAGRSQVASQWWVAVIPLAVGLAAAGGFSGIVFPVSRVLSSGNAGATGPDALQALGFAPAGFGIRLAAQLIDNAAALVVLILILVIGIINLPSGIAVAFRIALIVAIFGIFVISPGKRALRLLVLRPDGSPAGWGRRILRYPVSLFTFFIIDVLTMAIRKDRCALHDLACDTIVVRRHGSA